MALRDVTEKLSMDSMYREEERRAKERLRNITGSPAEQIIALGAPNDARSCVEWPAVFKSNQ